MSNSCSSICSSSDSIVDVSPKCDDDTAVHKQESLIPKLHNFNHLTEDDVFILKQSLSNEIPTHKLNELLNIPGHKRTKTEIQELVHIIEQIKFFKETKSLKNTHLQEIVKTLQIQHMKQGKTVFEFDDEADFFYIIIKGSVGVYVPNPLLSNWRERWIRYQRSKKWFNEEYIKRRSMLIEKNSQLKCLDEHLDKTVHHLIKHQLRKMSLRPVDHIKKSLLLSKDSQRLDFSYKVNNTGPNKNHNEDNKHRTICLSNYQIEKQLQLTEEDMIKIIEHDEFKKVQWFVKAVTLDQGLSFGELALIDGKPRRATVKCLQDCTFAKYSKTQYKKIFEEIERQERINQIKFFKQLPFLSHWSVKSIENLIINFRKKNYIKNQIVYNQNDPVKEVYIVESGEFQIIREKKVSIQQHQNFKNLIGPHHSERPLKFTPQLKSTKLKVNLSVVGTSQIFGHEDILRGKQRTTQVTCKSLTGVIYCISAQEFIARFLKDDKTWESLKKNAQKNDHNHIQRLRMDVKLKKIEKNNEKKSCSPPTQQLSSPQKTFNFSTSFQNYTNSPKLKGFQTTNDQARNSSQSPRWIGFQTTNDKVRNSSQLEMKGGFSFDSRIKADLMINFPNLTRQPTRNVFNSNRFRYGRKSVNPQTQQFIDRDRINRVTRQQSEVSNGLEMINHFRRERLQKYVKIASSKI